MKIAVVQHRLRENAAQDARALAAAAVKAAAHGAEFIVLPEALSLHTESPERELLNELLEPVSAFCLIPHVGPEVAGLGFVTTLPVGCGVSDQLGAIALLMGDACMDPAELAAVAAERPALATLVPRSETDLQAEAVLELALQLSSSLSGLVLVAECAGAEAGVAGHGGSAIVMLGELVAEAGEGDDILIADVALPIPQPSPREPLPAIPPLLAQRFAHDLGRTLMPEYPADLS